MDEIRRFMMEQEENLSSPLVGDDLPLKVAEDWDEVVSRACLMAEVIDKHLDFESKLQGRELRPTSLCPEQRVGLATDLASI